MAGQIGGGVTQAMNGNSAQGMNKIGGAIKGAVSSPKLGGFGGSQQPTNSPMPRNTYGPNYGSPTGEWSGFDPSTATNVGGQLLSPTQVSARNAAMAGFGDAQIGGNNPQASPINAEIPQASPINAEQPMNINEMAAAGIKGAGMGTAQGMQFQPGQVATTNLDPYMNPYTSQVIEANEADILRGANKGLDMLGAQASAGKAFGGSRHGVAMGEMGRDVVSQLAQSSAGLRQGGFDRATALAQGDIANQMAGAQHRLGASGQLADISNLGFGMGQTVTNNLERQGTQQQALQQALIDAAKGQYGGYTGAPAQGLSYLNQALGVTQAGQTQTNTKNPGLFDYLTLGASMM